MTAFTPGSASAAAVSIDLMRACACGERRIFPYSIPGNFRSAPYSARPVTLGTPSGRIGRVPTHLKRLTESVTIVGSFTASLALVALEGGAGSRRGRRKARGARPTLIDRIHHLPTVIDCKHGPAWAGGE